jgi:hypothetical protein
MYASKAANGGQVLARTSIACYGKKLTNEKSYLIFEDAMQLAEAELRLGQPSRIVIALCVGSAAEVEWNAHLSCWHTQLHHALTKKSPDVNPVNLIAHRLPERFEDTGVGGYRRWSRV